MERMTIMEVYTVILAHAQASRANYDAEKNAVEKSAYGGESHAFYKCAMLLEQTAEINPPIKK